jgi:hypothetical protein
VKPRRESRPHQERGVVSTRLAPPPPARAADGGGRRPRSPGSPRPALLGGGGVAGGEEPAARSATRFRRPGGHRRAFRAVGNRLPPAWRRAR